MTKVEGTPIVDQAKFNTYMNTSSKASSPTIRQQMMGNFVDAVDKFQQATGKAYEAAGVDNPFQPIGMSALKESLNLPSAGSKLADLWYEKLAPETFGSTLGAAVGGLGGEHFGQGFVGGLLGKEVLGPAISAVLKPVMEKYPGVDLKAFKAGTALAKNIVFTAIIF